MKNFLKVSEMPKNSKGDITKVALKKAIENKKIAVYEINYENDNSNYSLLENTSTIFQIWDGFRYAPKYQGLNNIASACLGTSFYYKFKTI